jgi:hypothetical protein
MVVEERYLLTLQHKIVVVIWKEDFSHGFMFKTMLF